MLFLEFFLHVISIGAAKLSSEECPPGFFFTDYFSLVAHLSDAPRRRLVVTRDSARIQDETTEISAWFFNVLGV